MANADPIAWRDIVGQVSIHFCESDWDTVRDLVLDTGMHPLSRCNVARASFDLREDFEALLNDTRAEPNQTELEADLVEQARSTLEKADDPLTDDRDLVEAGITLLALEEFGVVTT